MPRPATCFYWKSRGCFATDAGGRRTILVRGPKTKANRELAVQGLAQVLAARPTHHVMSETVSVSELIDLFLCDCASRMAAGEMKSNTLKSFYRPYGRLIKQECGDWCVGPPILARAFSGPKHVGVIHVMVVVSGAMAKTFETTCLAENHHESLVKALDQARSVRRASSRASWQFRRKVSGGLIPTIASKPSIKNRPSTATNRAIGSDKTCKSRRDDYARC